MKRLRIIDQANLQNKRVLLRAGWDVPLKKFKIQNSNRLIGRSAEKAEFKIEVDDDTRIKETLPTIEYLFEQGIAHLTIMFHVGRPHGRVVPEMSVKAVAQRFQGLVGDKVDLARVSILENLRFDAREESNDRGFAKELAEGQDIYVNDAFSNCHRNHASMAAITEFLSSYAGLAVAKEAENLASLFDNPPRPFVVVIGGAKIEDKIGVIDQMAKLADRVLVGGKSGIELNYQLSIKKLSIDSNVIPLVDSVNGLDIGPKTIEFFSREIAKAETIFWNGNMGKSEEPKYAKGTQAIARAIASAKAKVKLIGGGDTSKAISDLGLEKKMTYVSTGGGASLEFLAQNGDLPALRPLYVD